MDGVLIDSGAHHRAAWRALLDELGVVPAEPDYWRLTIGRPSVEAVPLLLGRETSRAEAQQLAARKQEHYRRLAGGGPALVRGVAEFVGALAVLRVPRAVATSAARQDVEGLLTRWTSSVHTLRSGVSLVCWLKPGALPAPRCCLISVSRFTREQWS